MRARVVNATRVVNAVYSGGAGLIPPPMFGVSGGIRPQCSISCARFSQRLATPRAETSRSLRAISTSAMKRKGGLNKFAILRGAKSSISALILPYEIRHNSLFPYSKSCEQHWVNPKLCRRVNLMLRNWPSRVVDPVPRAIFAQL